VLELLSYGYPCLVVFFSSWLHFLFSLKTCLILERSKFFNYAMVWIYLICVLVFLRLVWMLKHRGEIGNLSQRRVYITGMIWNGDSDPRAWCAWIIRKCEILASTIMGVTRLGGARSKKKVWRLPVRTWGLSEENVLWWRKYLWHCWAFLRPIVIRRSGNCAPVAHPLRPWVPRGFK